MNYSIEEIQQRLPHKYPFLLIDRVIDGEEGKWVEAIKNVTINEPFFQGHFPGYPIMPGVLLIEAMAQAGAIAILSDTSDALAFFTSIKNAKFKREVKPGDQLHIRTELIKRKLNIGFAKGDIRVKGQVVASCEFSFAIQNKNF